MKALDVNLKYIPKSDVEDHWGWVGPLIKRAFEKAPGGMTVEQIHDWARDGAVTIWAVEIGSVPFACFVAGETSDDTVEILVLAGRDMDSWLESVVIQFCNLANINGFPKVRFGGRRGWQKVLEPLGFQYQRINQHNRVEMQRTQYA